MWGDHRKWTARGELTANRGAEGTCSLQGARPTSQRDPAEEGPRNALKLQLIEQVEAQQTRFGVVTVNMKIVKF